MASRYSGLVGRLCLVTGMFLGICSGVCAESQPRPTAEELSAKAAEMGKATFIRRSGQVLQFEEIEKLPEETQEAIFLEMSEHEAGAYAEWLMKGVRAIKARNAEADKNIEALKAEGAELGSKLIEVSEQYVSNMERGAPGQKKALFAIIEKHYYPEDLKRRARALLNSDQSRWFN